MDAAWAGAVRAAVATRASRRRATGFMLAGACRMEGASREARCWWACLHLLKLPAREEPGVGSLALRARYLHTDGRAVRALERAGQ